MALRTARPFASRARHLIAFVAIVWGVAATFVAFEFISLSAVDVALSHPGLFGDLMLSRDRHGIHVLRSAHWQRAAAAVDNDQRGRRSSGALAARYQPRSRCALPAVRGFESSNARTAGSKAETTLRRDSPSPRPNPSRPSRSPTRTPSSSRLWSKAAPPKQRGSLPRRIHLEPASCSSSGRSGATRKWFGRSFPEKRTVFGMEIRHHAMRADVPAPLWSPMLELTAADAKREDIIAATETLTDAVTTYLTGQR